jgi:hypothetical protein
MPWPSSVTRISSTPPPSSSISTRVAPASMAFSRTSLTTDAGRSITSPAAIWLTKSVGSGRMLARPVDPAPGAAEAVWMVPSVGMPDRTRPGLGTPPPGRPIARNRAPVADTMGHDRFHLLENHPR